MLTILVVDVPKTLLPFSPSQALLSSSLHPTLSLKFSPSNALSQVLSIQGRALLPSSLDPGQGSAYCQWGAGSSLPLWLSVWVSALSEFKQQTIAPWLRALVT
ncbi:hypothetical protein TNCV_4725651 [Trichonephila clavipes]|nr:hypothetical protein TNCV_4725651 [Trichonephila clavipes]